MATTSLQRLNSLCWLKGYLSGRMGRLWRGKSPEPTHVMFQFVDHFELAGKSPRLAEWLARYPGLAEKHRDADGRHPQHTWYYALDLLREDELPQLRGLVEAGYGEVELHWHHHHESAAALEEKLQSTLPVFQKYGFMLPAEQGKPGCFAFIHGNWSLNNSLGADFCGVDNEIEVLKRCGCYGDFTFPALHCSAQPSVVNTIHYASFAAGRAGYARGGVAQVGREEKGDEMMIFQGPLTVNWRDWRFKWHPMLENGEIGASLSHDDPCRIDAWIREGIHVKGRPEWVFVKVFCHGGQDYRAVLGDTTDAMFRYLEQAYNDGSNYLLHYVTSREAYNIVKAAEDGKRGDPNEFRDYLIPPPARRAPPA